MRRRIEFLRPAAAVVNGETVEVFSPAYRVWADVTIPTVKGQLGEMALAGGAEASKTVYRIVVSRLPAEVTMRWRLRLEGREMEVVALEKTADKGAIFTYILAQEVV